MRAHKFSRELRPLTFFSFLIRTALVGGATASLTVFGCAGTEGPVLSEWDGGFGGEGAGLGGQAPVDGGGAGAPLGGASGLPDAFWLEACSPQVVFENTDTSEQGASVEAALGDPTALVQSAAHAVCRTWYRSVDEVPQEALIEFVLEPTDKTGVIAGHQIRLSTDYLVHFDVASGQLRDEANGMLHFFLSHIYQHVPELTPSWIISGKSDFVRLSAGLTDPAQRSAGGAWTDGFERTAFFLAWLSQNDADFIYELNQRMNPALGPYSDDIFIDLTGEDLATLWDSYQASF